MVGSAKSVGGGRSAVPASQKTSTPRRRRSSAPRRKFFREAQISRQRRGPIRSLRDPADAVGPLGFARQRVAGGRRREIVAAATRVRVEIKETLLFLLHRAHQAHK